MQISSSLGSTISTLAEWSKATPVGFWKDNDKRSLYNELKETWMERKGAQPHYFASPEGERKIGYLIQPVKVSEEEKFLLAGQVNAIAHGAISNEEYFTDESTAINITILAKEIGGIQEEVNCLNAGFMTSIPSPTSVAMVEPESLIDRITRVKKSISKLVFNNPTRSAMLQDQLQQLNTEGQKLFSIQEGVRREEFFLGAKDQSFMERVNVAAEASRVNQEINLFFSSPEEKGISFEEAEQKIQRLLQELTALEEANDIQEEKWYAAVPARALIAEDLGMEELYGSEAEEAIHYTKRRNWCIEKQRELADKLSHLAEMTAVRKKEATLEKEEAVYSFSYESYFKSSSQDYPPPRGWE